MKERWVVNASPIICLAKAGQIDLLLKLADEIIVPQPVAEEIRAGPISDPARQALEGGKLVIVETVALPEILAWDLGKGETAVLSYTMANPGWTAIIDDLVEDEVIRVAMKQTVGEDW